MGQRKSMAEVENFTTRFQIDEPIPSPDDHHHDEDSEDKNDGESSASSDDGAQNADTPDTPSSLLSPAPGGRKKFPSELKVLKCTWEGCDKVFNRPARLATHLNSHKNERPFKCTYEGCDKDYMDNKHLTAHIKASHTRERTWICGWEGCGKNFTTGTRLRRHREVHKGENRHRCTGYPGCNETFRKHNTLQRHIREVHLELAPFTCTYVDPETGIQCDQGFTGSVGLKKHEQNVHYSTPQFFCPHCVITTFNDPDGSQKHLAFKTEAKLQVHMNKEHLECEHCHLKIGSKHALKKHIESQHSGKSLEERKNIPCPVVGCEKTFTKKSNLNIHIQGAHNGVRYFCGTYDVSNVDDLYMWDPADGCGKEYVNKASLENHVRTFHLGLSDLVNASRKKNVEYDEDGNEIKKKGGTKPYRPPAVDEILGRAYGKDPRRKYPCPMEDCPYKFIRLYDLLNHLRAGNGHRLDEEGMQKITQEGLPAIDPSLSNDIGKIGGYAFNGAIFGDLGGDGAFDVPMADHNRIVEGFDASMFPQRGDIEVFDAPTFYLGEVGGPGWSTDMPGDDGKFWVGADDGNGFGGNSQDEFQFEEIEMRRLID